MTRIVRLCPGDFSASQGPELRAQVAGDGQQGPGVAGQQRPVPARKTNNTRIILLVF
jgi:hypothetical protein